MMFRCMKLRMIAVNVHLTLFLDAFRYELPRSVPGEVYRLVDQFCWCCGLVRGSAKVAISHLTYLAHRPAVGLFGTLANPRRY